MIALISLLAFATTLLVISLVIAWDKIIVGKTPFISIPQPTLNEIISNITIKPHSVFYDLGCGDGRVLITATQKQPQASYIGVEKAFVPYLLARLKTSKYKNITIVRGDILKIKITDSAILFCYLLPELLARVPKHCPVISVEYMVPGRTPTKVIKLKKHSRLVSKMFFY